MKKTGKALSLVLSLALVVSSLATTFASAAVTKTEYLGASDSHVTVNLVNGRSGETSKTDVTSFIPYSITGTTSDHLTVAGMTAQDVAMSGGQDLVTATPDTNSSKIFLSLKDSSLAGSETLAVRYTATNHRYTAPSQDILFSVVKYYTVKVHKLNGYEVTLDKTSLDKFGTVVSGKMTQKFNVEVDKYVLAGGQTSAGSLGVPQAQQSTNIEKNNTFDTSSLTSADAGIFFVKVSSSNTASYATTPGTSIPVTLTAPTGSDFLNQGGLVVYAVQTTTDANNKIVLNTANTITASATVTNTITLDADHNAIKTWHGSTWAVKSTDSIDEKSSGVADSLNSSVKIPVAGAINVTNANINLSTTTTMDGNAIVGDVNGGQKFVMNGGYAKSIGAVTDISEFDLTKGTVGTVSAATVSVAGGTTGAISATAVTLDASDAKVPTVVGTVTAKTIKIYSKNASVTTGAIKMDGDSNPVDSGAATGDKLAIYADKLSVPSIDFDKYNTTLELDGYVGTLPAPVNAENGGITVNTNSSNSTKSNATLTGAVNVKTILLTEGALNIASSLNVDTVSGAGTLTIPAGKMFVNSSISGISLKLSDATLSAGMTAFTATAYKVYDGMFTPVGFTIDYDALNAVTNRTTDVFKIKTVVFAGLTIAPVSGTSNKIVKGATASFKATSYPSGTALPANTKIDLTFNGSSDNFTAVPNGDTIAITATKYDDLFASLNKGTITATLVDTNTNTPVYTYPSATYDVQMITKPETVYTSDTTVDKTIKVGEQYTYKITSSDGSDPKFGFGTNGIANIVKSWKTTSGTTTFYYYTIQGVKEGAAGAFTTADKAKVNVVTVKGLAYKSDTSKVTIATGHHYTFKITADKNAAAPVFQVCTFSAKNTVLTKTTKNADGTISYEYTVTANGSPKGDHGAYVNGVNVAVVTVK